MAGSSGHVKQNIQRSAYSRVSTGGEQARGFNQEQTTGLLTGAGDGPPPVKYGVDYINSGEEDQMEIYGYRQHFLYACITWIFVILTGGILRLIFHWWPHWMLFATHKKCPLPSAEKVLIVELYQKKHKCLHVKTVSTISAEDILNNNKSDITLDGDCWDDQVLTDRQESMDDKLTIHLSGGVFKELDVVRMFHCKKLRYVWDPVSSEFHKLHGLDKQVSTMALHQQKGLSAHEQFLRRVVYGANEIIVPVRGILALLFLEVLNPFYVFQFFSFCLWFADDYMYYAMAILAMSIFGVTMAIIQTRKNQLNLSNTVHSSDVATVLRGRNGVVDPIPTENLVPGDLLVIPSHGCIMHCDAVLLSGNCIVNESMLTGESVPITKTPLPNLADVLYDSKEHAKHTLFCGTQVIQTRYISNEPVLAVVIRTGFSTAKGDLVRSIMYPPPVDFKFEHDSYKFVELLACIASIGFIYTVITKYLRGISISSIALQALDLITIVVPPALPAAMTVGRFYAQNRLQSKKVYCISPRTINVSGSIDCVCFDKTGTLTEDGLDMWGAVPVIDRKFLVPVKNIQRLSISEFLIGMTTCHSLTVIDGKLCGDPLDLKMFESTGWILEEPEVNDNSKFDVIFPTVVKPPEQHSLNGVIIDYELPLEIGIVRQFTFSSSLQRMSVICRRLGAPHFQVYCKGSPEMILSLSRPDTIPQDFSTVLEEYTQEGYRVIALAYKDLPKVSYAKVQRISRDEAESNLTFLGLIVMENRLKPETTGIITMLREASIRTVMVTGDNTLTALSVARNCGIISPWQQVIEVHGIPAQSSQPAQLLFTVADYCVNSPGVEQDCSGPELNNSNSITSFESVESSSVNGTISCTVTSEDLKSPEDGHPQPSNYCFAMTGKTWAMAKSNFPDILPKFAVRGAVFARMSPDQKQQLVQELQAVGYYVAMCGDGANDCGALKAAHAGISLSEAESSVASPFTSKEANISCVPRVIREGRAALVTSFGIFKYMAAYSLTQFITVMILYSIDSNLTDIEFLYIDLFVITVFAFFFGRTEAFEGPLVKQPPILSLISLAPILSLLLQLLLVIIVQWGSFYTIQQASWFKPYDGNDGVASYENFALFTVSSMQYIILALVFSKGAPYRKSIFSNYGFLISLIFLSAFTLYLTLGPIEWLQEKFELKLPPDMNFRLIMVAFGFTNLIIAAFIEYFIVDYLVFQKMRFKFRNINKTHRRYLAIEHSLNKDRSWPPLVKKSVIESMLPSPVKLYRPPATVTEICMESEHNCLPRTVGLTTPFTDGQNVPVSSISGGQLGSTSEVILSPDFLSVPNYFRSETSQELEQTTLCESSSRHDTEKPAACHSASAEVHFTDL
ncbi:polyamine-transporting ATPase 13A3 [Anabrus simplex]|uniref:polyamine-transporting ATPase 13A3 n=1 Tax=Anabrus simplex TaxID=316456 RepID=UPI0035A2B021